MLGLCFFIIGAAGYLTVDDMRRSLYREHATDAIRDLEHQLTALIGEQRSALGDVAVHADVIDAAARGHAPGSRPSAEPITELASPALAACLASFGAADDAPNAAVATAACQEHLRPALSHASAGVAPGSHYDLLQPVRNDAGHVIGHVVMRFSAAPLVGLVRRALSPNAYLELHQQQPDGTSRVVVAEGNRQRPQRNHGVTVALGAPEWTIVYWPTFLVPPILSGDRIYYVLAIVCGVLLLGFAVVDVYRRTANYVRQDIQSLAAIFRELRGGRLNTRHSMKLEEFANLFLYVRDSGRRLAEERERLVELGFVDHLSRLSNRRHFEIELRKLFKRSRTSGPSSVLILDLDRFKTVNDHHGHAAGDAFIRGFANALRLKVRETDFLARIGGDEFCIVYRFVDVEQAKVLAQRLRDELPRQIEIAPGIIHELSWAGGLSAMRRTDRNDDDVLKRADEALIQAKALGRNMTLAYGSTVRGRRAPVLISARGDAAAASDAVSHPDVPDTEWPIAQR